MCQTRNVDSSGKAPMVSIPIKSSPWSRVACDVVGPLRPTARKNRFLLVFCDYFSKWPEVFAVSNIETKTVADKFLELVARHSCPEQLLTDEGTNFTSQVLKDVCKLLDCKKFKLQHIIHKRMGWLNDLTKPWSTCCLHTLTKLVKIGIDT